MKLLFKPVKTCVAENHYWYRWAGDICERAPGILNEALFNPSNPFLLKPMQPQFMLDKTYILYALGLLSVKYPYQALHMAKKYLVSCNALKESRYE